MPARDPNTVAYRFENDALLPAQFFGNLCTGKSLKPEESLMLAIIEDAVTQVSARGTSVKLQHQQQAALRWFHDPEDRWIFSFRGICGYFGWDPVALRDRVTALRSTGRKKDGPGTLPVGISYHATGRLHYRVTVYRAGKSTASFFATLEEAIAFRAAHRPVKLCGVAWEAYPLCETVQQSDRYTCRVCRAPLVRGQRYYSAGYSGKAHETCVLNAKKGVLDGTPQTPDNQVAA